MCTNIHSVLGFLFFSNCRVLALIYIVATGEENHIYIDIYVCVFVCISFILFFIYFY